MVYTLKLSQLYVQCNFIDKVTYVIKHLNKSIKYVTVSAKTVPNGTFGILRNTILKH